MFNFLLGLSATLPSFVFDFGEFNFTQSITDIVGFLNKILTFITSLWG